MNATIAEMEAGWREEVQSNVSADETIAFSGASCLVGFFINRSLFVANIGDCRAVIGRKNLGDLIKPHQITADHNASVLEERELVRSQHSDPRLVLHERGSWLVKGTSALTRSIGDAYLKEKRFHVKPADRSLWVSSPVIYYPSISSIPSVYRHDLLFEDEFIVFASAGLFEYLSNEEVIFLVKNNSRIGIAKVLLKEAATRMSLQQPFQTHDERRRLQISKRRYFYDMVAAVVFFDHEKSLSKKRTCGGEEPCSSKASRLSYEHGRKNMGLTDMDWS